MRTSVAELIADRIDAMPAGERRAAQTLIANYPLIGLKTVADFSQQAGVSSPTILRFVSRLGFQNYPDSSPRFRTSSPSSCSRRRRAPTMHSGPDMRGGIADARGDARQYPRDVPPCFGPQLDDIVALLSNRRVEAST